MWPATANQVLYHFCFLDIIFVVMFRFLTYVPFTGQHYLFKQQNRLPVHSEQAGLKLQVGGA